MVPIALTCPVWWVARWAARLVASLAVVIAFSLGAATLPVGATVHATPRPVEAPSADGAVRPGPVAAATGSRVRSGILAEPAGTAAVDAGSTTAGTSLRDASGIVPAAVPPSAQPPARVVPVDRQHVPAGPVPAVAGARAPPAG